MTAYHARAHRTLHQFVPVVLLLGLLLGTTTHTAAAEQLPTVVGTPAACPTSKQIDKWKSEKQLEHDGFFLQAVGTQTQLGFERDDLALTLGADLSTGDTENYADVTEFDPEYGLGQPCWRPTATHPLVMEVSLRFAQPQTPPGVFENILLWNGGQTTVDSPATGIGVTRSMSGPYSAVISQDFVFSSPPQGLLRMVPLPTWLDATQWHRIRITVTEQAAAIEVIQGDRSALIVEQTLLHAPEPLAVDFTIDNQQIPGLNVPVQVSDTIFIANFTIGYP